MTRAKGCLILFILSVIAGTIAGYYLVKLWSEPDLPKETQEPLLLDPTPSINPDMSVLVVGVDNLQYPKPALEGAWIVTLVENVDGIIHLELRTLYPIVEETVSSTRQIPFTQPHQVIQIDPFDLPSADNLAPISLTPEQWSQTIVLDEAAINTIIMMQNLNFKHPAPTPVPGVFTKPWEDPQATYDQHVSILTLLCSNPTPLGDPHNIDIIIGMVGTHIRSTLTASDLRSLWQVINYVPGKQVVCTPIP
jgi:hypothetical protein